jgi:hypothetical protein
MFRLEVAEGPDRAGELANPHVLGRGIKARQVAIHLRIPVEQLQPEGGRFSMHAVGAADDGRVLELESAPPQHFFQAKDALAQQPGGGLHLQRLRRIHHVIRGQPVVQPAGFGADLLRYRSGEGDDVMLHLGLDLMDACQIEVGLVADRHGGLLRHDAVLGQRFAGGGFHFQPHAVLVLVGPDGAHAGPCVACDQTSISLPESSKGLCFRGSNSLF